MLTFQVVFVQVFTVLVFTIQAPLVGPRAFGLVALVMVFVGFCESVVTAVTVDTLISIHNVEELHFSTATMATGVITLIVGVIMFACSGFASALFGDPALAPVLRVMSILPFLSALWAAPNAQTKREMQFAPTLIRSIASMTLGGIAGVVLALWGGGVWSLVVQALVHRLTGAIALWTAVPVRFRFACSRRHLRELSRIAGSLLAVRCMSWATGQIPRLILGGYLGTVDLGLFSLGTRLSDILVKLTIEPRSLIARISFRRFTSDRSGFEAAAERLFMRTSALCFPIAVGGAVLSPLLVKLWLGPRWYGGVQCIRLLLLICIPYATFYCATAILLACNNRRSEVVITATQTGTVALLALLGAPFGLVPATGAITLAFFLVIPLPLIILRLHCELPLGISVAAQLPALMASLLMGAMIWIGSNELAIWVHPIALLLGLTMIGAVTYAVAMAALAPQFVHDWLSALWHPVSRGAAVE